MEGRSCSTCRKSFGVFFSNLLVTFSLAFPWAWTALRRPSFDRTLLAPVPHVPQINFRLSKRFEIPTEAFSGCATPRPALIFGERSTIEPTSPGSASRGNFSPSMVSTSPPPADASNFPVLSPSPQELLFLAVILLDPFPNHARLRSTTRFKKFALIPPRGRESASLKWR